MADEQVSDDSGAAGSNQNSDPPGGTELPKLAGGESSAKPEAQYNRDLKSILVTSVLNLEKLDVDLYR